MTILNLPGDPTRFDIAREDPPPILTFDGGVHYCLGANLARRELAEALKILARRLPNPPRIGSPPWKPLLDMSGPTHQLAHAVWLMRYKIDAVVPLPAMFRPAPTGTHGMMRGMFNRSILAATAIAIAAIGPASPAYADPQCPASGCPHGPGSSPSYKDGYQSEHDYYSTPQNHAYLSSEMKNGYTAASACQVEMSGGSPPANPTDWINGCVDALHDLGFKP